MTPKIRKFLLTTHIACTVGWLGAVAAFLALSIAALTSREPEVMRGNYVAMDQISRFVVSPLSFGALATGLLQALGSAWGLFRYYWITAKFGLAIVATAALLMHQFKVVGVAAKEAAGTNAPLLTGAMLDPLKIELVRAPAIAIAVLLTILALAVYKPWGLTTHGRRTQPQRAIASQPFVSGMPLGPKLFLGVIAMLVLTFIVLHLTGHGFGQHH
ncbi:hypothetical protein [Dyella sp.]|uniref:hypothetical protein n=1 Tax=Dyella sp. TaxID=1869338 RepID=UPI002D11D14B|nr:hypothetical protein [Rhodanobacteraceae bacterium]